MSNRQYSRIRNAVRCRNHAKSPKSDRTPPKRCPLRLWQKPPKAIPLFLSCAKTRKSDRTPPRLSMAEDYIRSIDECSCSLLVYVYYIIFPLFLSSPFETHIFSSAYIMHLLPCLVMFMCWLSLVPLLWSNLHCATFLSSICIFIRWYIAKTIVFTSMYFVYCRWCGSVQAFVAFVSVSCCADKPASFLCLAPTWLGLSLRYLM